MRHSNTAKIIPDMLYLFLKAAYFYLLGHAFTSNH